MSPHVRPRNGLPRPTIPGNTGRRCLGVDRAAGFLWPAQNDGKIEIVCRLIITSTYEYVPCIHILVRSTTIYTPFASNWVWAMHIARRELDKEATSCRGTFLCRQNQHRSLSDWGSQPQRTHAYIFQVSASAGPPLPHEYQLVGTHTGGTSPPLSTSAPFQRDPAIKWLSLGCFERVWR